MSTARWKHKLRKLSNLNGADKWLLLRATGWLAIARIMLVAVPFRRLSERLPSKHDSTPVTPDVGLIERVGRSVAIAANHVPWRSDCFPQAIAARMLLNRCGLASTIHIGVERVGDDELSGHAWLTCGDTVVTGGAELRRYTEIHRLNE